MNQPLSTPRPRSCRWNPCSAITVILRTKGRHWWWSSGCTFCGYFNDTRDDVTNDDLHAQWARPKKFDNFADQAMVKVYTSSLLEDEKFPSISRDRASRLCVAGQGTHRGKPL